MYVIAKHRISDADKFFALSHVAAEEAPAGVYGRQFCPSRDRSEAVCLWESASLDAVRDYLDSLTREVSENDYFEVSPDHAIGIPAPIVSFSAYEGDAAVNYERYFVPAITAPLAEDLVSLAELRPGQDIVDIACGTGIVTRLAAERVGKGSTIVGVDLNPGMLAVARTAATGAVAVDWYEADAEALPLADELFDVAFCQFGLQFVAEKTAALREMRRVLKPGGQLFLSVPGPIPPLFALLEGALVSHLGPVTATFLQTVFSLHEPGQVRGLLADAGFADLDVSRSEKILPLPPPRDFLWQYVHSTPLAASAAQFDDERRAAIEREVVAGWQACVEQEALVLRQPFTVATARK